jgi:hypothetical protein
MTPTLRQIAAFLAVAETGSFSRAAVRLGLSQHALREAVRDREAALGVRLIDRTSLRVELAVLRPRDRSGPAPVLGDSRAAVTSAPVG